MILINTNVICELMRPNPAQEVLAFDSLAAVAFAALDVDGRLASGVQADVATDYAVATGTPYSVGDFVRIAFEHVGLESEKYVKCDPRYLPPTEVDDLIGDASKAREVLGPVAN